MNWDRKNPDACEDRDRHFAYTVIAEDLRFCGCGSHDTFVAEVVNVLRDCPLRHVWIPSDGFGQLGGELLLHLMDDAELIEHGTSIGGAWITDKGSRFLAVMDGKPDDWLDNCGYACSHCPEMSE